MREVLKLSAILAVTAAFCGALLVFADAKTKALRDASEVRREQAAAQSVLAHSAHVGALRLKTLPDGSIAAYGEDGAFAGVAARAASEHGYGGRIELIAGFDAEGTLLDFIVVKSGETPGLGAKIAKDSFRSGFRGRKYDSSWKLRKDGGTIDAVTSATISSRATVEAVADAAGRFPALREAATAGAATP